MNLKKMIRKALVDSGLIENKILNTIYQTNAILEIDRTHSLTEILTQVRSIEGVTVVSIVEPQVAMSDTKEKSIIAIKFMLKKTQRTTEFLKKVKKEVFKIPGVYSIRFKRTEVKRRKNVR